MTWNAPFRVVVCVSQNLTFLVVFKVVILVGVMVGVKVGVARIQKSLRFWLDVVGEGLVRIV